MAIPSFILQRLHRVNGATCQRVIETEVPARSIAYGGEGTEILVGHEDGVPRLWDVSHFELARAFISHEAPVLSVAARGSRWVTSCAGGRIRIWGGFGQPQREFRDENDSPCHAVEWNRDGTRVLSGHADRTARLYDPEGARRLKKMPASGAIRAVGFGPEDVQIGVTDRGQLVFWEADRSVVTAQFAVGEPQFPGEGDVCFGFSRDRRMIAAAVRGRDIHLSHWDDPVCVLEGHDDVIHSLAWSPEGRFLLSGSEDCTAKIWDTTTRHCVATLQDVCPVTAVAFHPHGHDCATITEDGTLRIYELESDWHEVDSAIEQALIVLDGIRTPLWPTSAPLDLDFVLDVWSDVRRRARHQRLTPELARRGEKLRSTILDLLQVLATEATPDVPPYGLERYKHPLFRVALADLRLAGDLCTRIGGDASALENLQRLQRIPTMEIAASGFTIPPKR